jgi:hypothetical protein
VKNAQRAPVAGLQLFMTQVLFVPNVPEEALVYVKRARAHGLLSEGCELQRKAESILPELREELIAVFLNLVAELHGFIACGGSEVFAG